MKQILISTMCALTLVVGCGKGPDEKADASPKNKTPGQPKDKPAKPDALQEAAQPLPAPKPSGLSTTSFAAVTKHLDAGGDFYLYWNANQLQSFAKEGLKKLEAFVEAEAPPHEKAEIELLLKLINAAYEESGLSSIDGLGASSFATGNGVRRHKVMIHHGPAKGDGLMWKALGSAPHELGGLKLMPATTAYAIHADLDVAGTFKWIKGFIASNLPAKQGAMLAELLEEANAEVPIEKIINGTGGEMGMYVTLNPDKMIEVDPFFLNMLGGDVGPTEFPPDPAAPAFPDDDGFESGESPAPRPPRDFDPSRDDAPPPATKGDAPFPDEGPGRGALPRGFPADPEEFDPGKPDMPKIKIPEPGLVLVLKVRGDTIPGLLEPPLAEMGAKEQTIDGVTLRTISVPPDEGPFPVSPTLMQVGDYMIFTSTLDLAKQVIAIQGGKAEGLAGTAEFKKLTNGLDLKANMITYTSKLLEDTFRKVADAMIRQTMMGPFGMDNLFLDSVADLYSLPFASQVTLLSVTGEGYLIQNQTTGHLPMDPAIATAVAAVPITVAAAASAPTMLPALAKAKARANRIKSISNLAQINKALQAYASDHDDKLPPADKWCDAIIRYAGSPLIFISPQDTEAMARFERGEKVSSYALNAALAGKNMFDIVDANTVLVFECNLGWNGTGGLAELRKHVPPDQWNIGTINGASFQTNPNDLQRRQIRWKPAIGDRE